MVILGGQQQCVWQKKHRVYVVDNFCKKKIEIGIKLLTISSSVTSKRVDIWNSISKKIK